MRRNTKAKPAASPAARLNVVRNFESFPAFLAACEVAGNAGNGKSSIGTGRNEFYGTENFEAAMRLARGGWAEGRKLLDEARALVSLPDLGGKSWEPLAVLSDEGDEVELGRYLEGEPECLIDWRFAEQPKTGRVARVVLNVSASCSVNAADLMRRGAAALALVDALESAGWRVELDLAFASGKDDSGVFVSTVRCKEASGVVEIDRFAFMLAHPSVLRRLFFRICEQLPESDFRRILGVEYGKPRDVPPALLGDTAGTIYFGKMCAGDGDAAALLAKIEADVARFIAPSMAAAV